MNAKCSQLQWVLIVAKAMECARVAQRGHLSALALPCRQIYKKERKETEMTRHVTLPKLDMKTDRRKKKKEEGHGEYVLCPHGRIRCACACARVRGRLSPTGAGIPEAELLRRRSPSPP